MSAENITDERMSEFLDKIRFRQISFDIDGVNADTAKSAVNLYNLQFSDGKTVTDLDGFYAMRDWIFEKTNSRNLAIEMAIKIWNDENVQGYCPMVSGAWFLSNYLYLNGIKPHYITSRPFFTRDVTLDWFGRNMPFVDSGHIHVGNGGGLQGSYKTQTIKDLGVDIHFEDSIEHALDIVENTPALVVLVRQPWNLKFDVNHPRMVVSDYNPLVPKLFLAYADLVMSDI